MPTSDFDPDKLSPEKKELLQRSRQLLKETFSSLAPLTEFLDWETQNKFRRQQPLDIMIGDGNHQSMIPKFVQVIGAEIISKYENTAIVIEDANPQPFMEQIHNDVRSDPQVLNKIMNDWYDNTSQVSDHYLLQAMHDGMMLTKVSAGTQTIFPDPRGKTYHEQNFTPAEEKIVGQYRSIMRTLNEDDQLHCSSLVKVPFTEKLTEEQKKDFASGIKKHRINVYNGPHGMQSYYYMDETINDNVNKALGPDNQAMPLTYTYGLGHMMKPNDLDDHRDIPYYAVIPDADSRWVIRSEMLYDPSNHRDFPKAAWMHDATDPNKQLLIMDKETLQDWHRYKRGEELTDEQATAKVRQNKAEYIGISEPQFKLWEKALGGDRVAQAEMKALAQLTPEAEAACKPIIEQKLGLVFKPEDNETDKDPEKPDSNRTPSPFTSSGQVKGGRGPAG